MSQKYDGGYLRTIYDSLIYICLFTTFIYFKFGKYKCYFEFVLKMSFWKENLKIFKFS